MGCAVAATDVGAVAEIVADGEDGVLVPAGLPEEAIVARFTDHPAGWPPTAPRCGRWAPPPHPGSRPWIGRQHAGLPRPAGCAGPGPCAGAGDRVTRRCTRRPGSRHDRLAGPARRAVRRPAAADAAARRRGAGGAGAARPRAVGPVATARCRCCTRWGTPPGWPASRCRRPRPGAGDRRAGCRRRRPAARLVAGGRPEAMPPVIEAATGARPAGAGRARALAALAASAGGHGGAAGPGGAAAGARGAAAGPGRPAPRRRQPPAAAPCRCWSPRPSAGAAMRRQRGTAGWPSGQALGLKLEGLAAIALHLKEALAGADARAARAALRRRERPHRRRLGAARPVAGGRLATLDLPEPVGPQRETAWLEVKAELGAFDRLALSPPPSRSAPGTCRGDRRRRGGGPRPWPAGSGPRCPGGGWCSRPIGTARRSACRAADRRPGRAAAAGLDAAACRRAGGAGGDRRPAGPAGGGPGARRAGAGGAAGGAAQRARPAAGRADGGAGRRRLAGGRALAAAGGDDDRRGAELSPGAPGARWSGWHPGVFGDGTCRLARPAARPAAAGGGGAGDAQRSDGPEEVLRVEIARLFGTRAVQPPPEAARRAPPPLRMCLRPAGAPAEAPVAAAVRLLERYLVPGGSYRHIDLLMEGVRAGEHAWPRLRCKLAVNGVVPSLEFRQRPDWPVLFETWPPGPSDAAGPLSSN